MTLAIDLGPSSFTNILKWPVFGLGFSLNASWVCFTFALNFMIWYDQNHKDSEYMMDIAIIVTAFCVLPFLWASWGTNPAWPVVTAWALWGVYEEHHEMFASFPFFPA